MIKEYTLRVSPAIAASEQCVIQEIAESQAIASQRIKGVRILKRSIDARQRNIFVNLKVRCFIDENPIDPDFRIEYPNVENRPAVIVVGAGPAGLFAALELILSGYKPIVLERGKDVTQRRKDIALISREQKIDPESNYSFGEGGAGAFSDGKLYTRSKKKGSVELILQTLCAHGASLSILTDAHPHIGTDKLPEVIRQIREQILRCGGEVHFETKMTELILSGNSVKGVITACGKEFIGAVILATGHSARDVYQYLNDHQIFIEQKGVAMGIRLEHPQQIIDQIQYHNKNGRGEFLPPAEYSFVTQVKDRGVYSFCMCPGGFVVPAGSGAEQVVVNGMSPSNRGSKWGNAGIVVEIRPEDIDKKEFGDDPLSMMRYQKELERVAWVNGSMKQTAPAQRMEDFIRRKNSFDLPPSSYSPGLIASPLHFWLPSSIGDRLREGLQTFNRTSKGFLTNEAILIGVETRTSSPVRITRDAESLQHIAHAGLFPCGEGAGYAGGIVSAAIDGQRCAQAAVGYMESKKGDKV